MHPIVKQKIEAGHCICAPRGLSVDPRCPIHKNQASNAERARYGMEHPLSVMCGCAKCQAAFKAEADARDVQACELPDAIRVPLDELEADAAYIIGRVAADGSCSGIMVEAIRRRTRAVREALLAHGVALPQTDQPGEPK